MNLVNNAMDALVDNKLNDPCIETTAVADKQSSKTLITVKDNGPGIPEEILKPSLNLLLQSRKVTEQGLDCHSKTIYHRAWRRNKSSE